jgi:outer membrane protein OmpA-like peptidoglycan-associated protein
MVPAYIFSIGYANIMICISLVYIFHASGANWYARLPSETRAALSSFLLAPNQHRSTSCGRAAISVVALVRDAQENAAKIGRQASTSPTNAPNHTRAFPRILKQAVLFDPNSTDLTSESQQRLTLDAGWLQRHPEVRVFVVGFCDALGSEECTHDLAEGRAAGVRQFLAKHGVGSSQIVGGRGWEKADPLCEAATPTCQAMNRRARIFIAESTRAH